MNYKLIVEQPNYDLQHIYESVGENLPKKLFSKGDVIMLNRQNLNGRSYMEEDSLPAIEKFLNENQALKKGRCVSELNHSTKPEVDLERICAKFVQIFRDDSRPDYYIGKAEILDTPAGRTLRHITESGITWGYSTKAVGVLEEGNGGSIVRRPQFLTIDSVFQPSINEFSQGILENKEFIIGNDGIAYEAFQKLEKHLSKYPSKHSDAIKAHILEGFKRLLKDI
jgi:Prohead core protein serine protease